ncbi:preprotein translocase subunit YajC [Saccharopolyspora erythraea NRRL 2338]|uniref:Preprotein translocase, YajC subunit n=2 Tax=Saccharopolyspora erythraea TaxID=1836 RepID=A4FBA9_SACEN|nr:preprotein translocase subunit YajC [Saccharopolyspora erythraea]EQD86469.1 preprotein translocase subunit YajC [Saccharopolyspora erythraea D]PFG95116.1 preprotein translocase subunit YajC [Saccharopolyspora erythraea NRRL 2338]QRK91790.1 preprotein translocase subunit YajC [Saccharopolyspora erythraea]CAM01334.1 preprotein translocase, YajC subunit [Saccharopolyspora erythraea NRRL 2338]
MDLSSLIFPLLIALLAVPLFLQARKQKRAMQDQQKLQNSLAAGDRVMTTSGLFGTVVSTSDDTIELEIASGITTTWVRAAVREKVETGSEAATETAASTDEESAESADKDTAEQATESKAQVAEPVEQQQKTN